MVCPKCNAAEGFVDVEFHGIKAKVCTCRTIIIMEMTEEYDRYFEEEQACKKASEGDSEKECPDCYFCPG